MPANPELKARPPRYEARGDCVLDSFGGGHSFRVVPVMGQSDAEATALAALAVQALNATPALPEEREKLVRRLRSQFTPGMRAGTVVVNPALLEEAAAALSAPVASLPDEEAVEPTEAMIEAAKKRLFEAKIVDVFSVRSALKDALALASIPSPEGLRRDYEALKRWWDMNPSLFQHRLAELEAALCPFARANVAFDYWTPEAMPSFAYPAAGTNTALASEDCPEAVGELVEADFRRAAAALRASPTNGLTEEGR